jgi:hypothetical protein
MNKNELELQKLVIRSENFSKSLGLVQKLATLAAVVGCVYLVMTGLAEIVSHKPESLNALALVIEKLKINEILGYVLAAGSGAGWYYERKGKQRAYKQLGTKRAEIEQRDAYHPSSDLQHDGLTPRTK